MFCNQCGSPNPDNSKFCSTCGSPIQKVESATQTPPQTGYGSQPSQPTYTPPVSEERDDPRRIFNNTFNTEWRKFVSSPLVISTIVTYAVYVVFNFVQMLSSMEMLGYYGINDSALLLIVLLGSAPNILTATGLFMVYADARDLSSRSINTGGLRIIKGTFIALAVLFGIGVFFMLIGMASLGDTLISLGILDATINAGAGTYVIIVLLACIVLGVIIAITIKLINNIIGMAEYAVPDTTYLGGYAVYCFVLSGINLILSVSGETFNIGVLLSLAGTIMFGITLLKFKSMLLGLSTSVPKNYF